MKKVITITGIFGAIALMGLFLCGCSSPATGSSNISNFYKDFYKPMPPGPLPFPVVQF